MSDVLSDNQLLAAIDLGSNSFHIAVARVEHGEVRKVASLSEKVQLAAGLDEDNCLSEQAINRGLDCLKRFAARLDEIDPSRIRIVATNALRQAENANEFIERAANILPKPIEIIAGREEARLIYLGVSQTLAGEGKRLVVDIGGGSTEFIIGENFEPLQTESLQMGCVAYTKQFFANGEINQKAFDKAYAQACKEVLHIKQAYTETGWDSVVGSSGTIKAARTILHALNLTDEHQTITKEGLNKVKAKLLQYKHVSHIDFPALKDDRKPVLPAGLAILLAIFDTFKIESMVYSDGALREGVMYDLLGRFRHEDIRDRSVSALIARYGIDSRQSQRVARTAHMLFEQAAPYFTFSDEYQNFLRWAALTHEIGLAVSHGGYHRHGAYLLQYSDIPGFSQVDQSFIAALVGVHRRKLRAEQLINVRRLGGDALVSLCLLLRLSVLLHNTRSDQRLPDVKLHIQNHLNWQLTIQGELNDWMALVSDLQDEKAQFENWGFTLEFRCV